ncbi:CYTH and CHAD domain-containing protein [Algihabitans albus]|uniref:CYTH and CHAD domain-containing protein n=1 Tax=Algihabitans albus TaxID=2164067 RepID=UPI000E5D040F|nr:CYTH and CHAD domain-containing protein [Algihabitans albus]
MGHEIELKLLLAPSQLKKLTRLPLLRAFAVGRSQSRQLDSTYFDTSDFLLRDRGMALRVRRIGDRRFQTLKMAPEAAAVLAEEAGERLNGVQHFLEFESEISGDLPELSAIDAPGLRDWFAEAKLGDRLEPVFTTAIARRTRLLRMADTEIELALDLGEIRAQGRSAAICEAELELKWGQPTRLFELAMMLAEALPLRLGGPTKAARGYDLFAGREPLPAKGQKPSVTSAMSAAEAFAKVMRCAIDQMRANEEAVFAEADPEGVHQLRVGVRRARAALSVFKPAMHETAHARLGEELRWLQRELGPARDFDVFLEDTVQPLLRRLPSEPSLRTLEQAVRRARDEAYKRAHASLEDPRYARLLLRLELFLAEGTWKRPRDGGRPSFADAPIGDLAAALLDKRQRQLRKLHRKAKGGDEAALHGVRIAAKKLRYAAEFFRDLYGRKTTRPYTDALAELQDTLGAVNDAVVGHRLLDELEPRLAKSGEDASLPVGIVMGWQAARIEDDLKRFEAVWSALRAHKPFWRQKN